MNPIRHASGDRFEVGVGHAYDKHDRLEYEEERDEDGRLHGYLTIWPQGAAVPNSFPLSRGILDRSAGWRASLEDVYVLLRQLGWQLSREERQLLEDVAREWAPGLLEDVA